MLLSFGDDAEILAIGPDTYFWMSDNPVDK